VTQAQPTQPPRKAANLIAIASGKGGVGKTFFSISLATALARAGRKVLLFDGDLGLANVDVQLGIMPPRDLSWVIAGKALLHQVSVPYAPGGFDVIAGRSGAGGLAALPPTRLSILAGDLADLAKNYDYAILDLGAGVDRLVRIMALPCGTRIVVATAEPTSLTDAYAFMKVSLSDDPQCDLRIVINQARTSGEGDKTYQTLAKACETFLKRTPPLLGTIRKDKRVLEAIRAQTPIFVKHSTSDAGMDIEAIAARLMARGAVAE
jgi:flagellar biosynthesis protein FlhG